MIGLNHKNFEDDKYFSLHWAVSNICNYKCHYCGVYKEEKYHNFHNIIEFINFINTIKNVDTVLFGGEPLIHPNILQIVGELNTNIRICTNLSENELLLRELIKINSDMKFVTSFHYEKANFNKFFQKVLFLVEYCKLVKVKVMWDSRFKNEIKNIYELFLPLEKAYPNFKVFLDMVYHPESDFTPEDIEYYDNIQKDKSIVIYKEDEDNEYTSYNRIRRMFNGYPNFYGWKCYVGNNGLFIDSNGDVSYCQTKKNNGKVIFNVNEDDYRDYESILYNPIVCDEDDFCTEVVMPRKKI